MIKQSTKKTKNRMRFSLAFSTQSDKLANQKKRNKKKTDHVTDREDYTTNKNHYRM